MSGEIIVHTLLIHRAEEQQYFQLNIPRDVSQIHGIITSVQLMDLAPVNPTGQVGMLQLQSTGKANGCYNSLVILEPAIAVKGDLSLTAFQAGFSQPNRLLKDGLAQRGSNSAEIILLPSCSCFYGNYKDLLGKRLGVDIRYRIGITLWTLKKKL